MRGFERLTMVCLLIQIPVFVLPSLIKAEQASVVSKIEQVKGFTMTLLDKNGKAKALISGSMSEILPNGNIKILDAAARVFNIGESTLIHSSEAVYDRKDNIIHTERFVRIDRRDMVITGTGLRWEPDNAWIQLYKDVKLEYSNKRRENSIPGAEAPGIIVTSEGRCRLNYNEPSIAVFKNKVNAVDKNVDIKAHLIKVFFDNKTHDIVKVEAYGSVKIKQPERESYCRKAVYFADKDKIILSGSPKIMQGMDQYTAQKITVYNKGKRVVFEPRAELVIYSGTEHKGI